jgi:hypothetical protein
MATSTSYSKGFRFLDLPAEIRLKVYRNIFVSERYVSPFEPNELSTQILRTCHTIHDEGVTVLYGENRFASDSLCWRLFKKRAGMKNIHFMQHLIWYVGDLNGVDNVYQFLAFDEGCKRSLQTVEMCLSGRTKRRSRLFWKTLSNLVRRIVTDTTWQNMAGIIYKH